MRAAPHRVWFYSLGLPPERAPAPGSLLGSTHHLRPGYRRMARLMAYPIFAHTAFDGVA